MAEAGTTKIGTVHFEIVRVKREDGAFETIVKCSEMAFQAACMIVGWVTVIAYIYVSYTIVSWVAGWCS